jgi:glycosyltransferase involved in cell wall biosynthesis
MSPNGDTKLDILHLAFEDHRRPGSGGGGLRTHEVNRRLAQAGHRVTVLTTRYRGAHPRIEDGVRYRPVGVAAGYYSSIVSYHLSLPFIVAASHPDLVVEDFAAPMSSILSPLWTRRPTIAVVQWLFAEATSARYRLPFYLVETLGVRLQRRFVAASDYMAREIRTRNPKAHVDVVYAGVEKPASHASDAPSLSQGSSLLYLGRLESGPKGLDLLLTAFADLVERHPDARLTIAGDGPGRADLEALATSLGVGDRVAFVGRVEGDAKWRLLDRSTILVVPSRYESFGLVALEALAAGTPVVAFDIPSMREILTDGSGALVPSFDTPRLTAELAALLDDPDRRAAMVEAGRVRVKAFDWDETATAQAVAYLAAVAEAPGRRRWWPRGR